MSKKSSEAARKKSEPKERKASEIAQAFAKRLIEIRQEKGITKLGLAKAAGIDRKFIYGIESGRQEPSLTSADKIAKALGTTLREMLPE